MFSFRGRVSEIRRRFTFVFNLSVVFFSKLDNQEVYVEKRYFFIFIVIEQAYLNVKQQVG